MLTVVFVGFLASTVLNLGVLLSPLFDLVGLPAGGRTLFFDLIGVLCALLIFLRGSRPSRLYSDLAKTALVWGVWLAYLAVRCNFDDPYSVTKLGRIILIQLAAVLLVTVVYWSNRETFSRIFLPMTILFGFGLLVALAIAPTQFEGSLTERLTLEFLSPVWLARGLALGALALLMVPKLPSWLKLIGILVLVVGILATGSRGPLIALLLTCGVWLLRARLQRPAFLVGALVSLPIVLVAATLVTPYVEQAIADYFTRGSAKSVLEQSGRAELFQAALEDGKSSPFVGVGLGNYGKIDGLVSFGERSFVRRYPHNLFLEIFAELGLIGLVLLFVLVRPGKWAFRLENPFVVLAGLSFLFSMTSGDLPANSEFFVLTQLAWLSARQSS